MDALLRLKDLVQWLSVNSPSCVILLENVQMQDSLHVLDSADFSDLRSRVQGWDKSSASDEGSHPDIIITMGGDGTLLYVASLFQGSMPPVMCFNFGSLGFLANFDFEKYQIHMAHMLAGNCDVTVRMRLMCEVETLIAPIDRDGNVPASDSVHPLRSYHILNEIVLDRGPSPYISNLQIYCDGALLTVVQGDGLIISTPTGSTAYSV